MNDQEDPHLALALRLSMEEHKACQEFEDAIKGITSNVNNDQIQNEDPDLALALRLSMEEQRTRQEFENANGGADQTEDPELALALKLSMEEQRAQISMEDLENHELNIGGDIVKAAAQLKNLFLRKVKKDDSKSLIDFLRTLAKNDINIFHCNECRIIFNETTDAVRHLGNYELEYQ